MIGPRPAAAAGPGTTWFPIFGEPSISKTGRCGIVGNDAARSAVSRIRSLHELTPEVRRRLRAGGLPTLDDYNRGDRDGAFVNLTNQRRGQRASTARSYLKPVLGRANLRLIRGALVDKILFDGKRACGVRFRLHGARREVKVRGEVLLSAGTIQSPAILLRSGIGPGAALRAHGIEVQRGGRARVGENLQDHAGVMIGKFVNVPTYNSQMGPLNGLRHLGNYLLFRRGPLASAAVQAMAWARSEPTLAEPDIHLNWFPFGVDYNVDASRHAQASLRQRRRLHFAPLCARSRPLERQGSCRIVR